MTRCASRRPPGVPCRAAAALQQQRHAELGFERAAAFAQRRGDQRLARGDTRPALSDERVQLNTRETGAPTIAVGLVTEADQAEASVANGQADLVALARGMLFDPRWPWHAAAQLGAQVEASTQCWRSHPHGMNRLFGEVRIGMR